jgi:F0F1-type ATP synthase assembly protein I
LSALVGIVTHIVLDHFTHDWGWFAQNVSWYRDVFFAGPFGRDWTAYRMAQYLGHVVGTVLCLVVLARLGRQRWMADRAAMVPETQRTALSTLTLAASTLTGCLAGVLWIVTDPMGSATDLIRLTAATFVAMAMGSLVVSRSSQRVADTHELQRPRPDVGG